MKLDPRPLSQYLDALRVEYEAGDPNALMHALWTCLDQRTAAPEWVAESFLRRLAVWHGGRARTLDEALGFKLATPKRTAAHRRERLDMLRVADAAYAERLADPNLPVGPELFARVAATVGMSAATVRRRYYAAAKDPKIMRASPSARTLDAALLGPLTVPTTEAMPRSKARRATR
jgi:hypothetical protein